MDGLLQAVGDGIAGLVGGAVAAIGQAVAGIAATVSAIVPGGLLPVVAIGGGLLLLIAVLRR